MGAISSDGLEFLGDLGRRITQVTDDILESAFMFQRLSVLIQRYNAVATRAPLPTQPLTTNSTPFQLICFQLLFLTLGIFITEGLKIIMIVCRTW